MARRPPLTVRMRDAWRLVSAAVDAGVIETAQGYAAEALRLSGWDRYLPGSRLREDQIFYCTLVPRGWGLYARVDGDCRLLVHPDAGPLVSDWAHLRQLMRTCEDLGGGLVRLSETLAEVLLHAVTPPDDLSEITTSR